MAVMTLTACGQNTQKEMKTLVAYFSATGTTKAVAKDLAEVASATLYEIKPEVKYTAADLDWRDKQSRSTLEMQDKSSRPAIVKDLEDADSYDLIYIGFPVWWYTAPTIINTFIETYGFAGKTVIFFATSGGSDVTGADKQFHAQYPDIDWKAGKLLNRPSKKTLQEWVAGNKKSLVLSEQNAYWIFSDITADSFRWKTSGSKTTEKSSLSVRSLASG